jgi:hypothetical protein
MFPVEQGTRLSCLWWLAISGWLLVAGCFQRSLPVGWATDYPSLEEEERTVLPCGAYRNAAPRQRWRRCRYGMFGAKSVGASATDC